MLLFLYSKAVVSRKLTSAKIAVSLAERMERDESISWRVTARLVFPKLWGYYLLLQKSNILWISIPLGIELLDDSDTLW